MIRAVVDANVFISFLLYPSGDGAPARVVRAALLHRFVPLVSPRLLHEIEEKSTGKPYLASRIAPVDITWLFERLIEAGEGRDDADIAYPTMTRDAKDDYLLTNAVVYRADYLVSGNRDLPALGGEFEGLRIVSPAAFAALLDQIA